MTYRIVLLLAFSIIFGNFQATGKKKKNRDVVTAAVQKDSINYRLIGSPLPPLHIQYNDGSVFTTKDIDTGQPFILVMFNPTCGHCEDQAQHFLNNYEAIKNLQLKWVYSSVMPKDLINDFILHAATKGAHKLSVGEDKSDIIIQTFNYVSLPQVNIYDKNQKLIKIFGGGVNVDTLRQYLK